MSRDPDVQRVGVEISNHLAKIAALFKDDTKLTFLARSPSKPDGSRDMVLTDDSLREAIRALSIRERDETRGAHP